MNDGRPYRPHGRIEPMQSERLGWRSLALAWAGALFILSLLAFVCIARGGIAWP